MQVMTVRAATLLASLAVVVVAAAAAAAPVPASCDKEHSKIVFTAYTKLFDAAGTFKAWRTSGTIDPDNLSTSQATVTVDTTTLDTGSGARDEHLRSEDFFHVDKFPKATFVTKKIEPKGGDKFDVTGDLTIRGVTKTLTVPATITKGEVKPGEATVRVKTKIKLRWKDFGMPWKGSVFLPDIKDDVDLDVDLNFLAKSEPPKG